MKSSRLCGCRCSTQGVCHSDFPAATSSGGRRLRRCSKRSVPLSTLIANRSRSKSVTLATSWPMLLARAPAAAILPAASEVRAHSASLSEYITGTLRRMSMTKSIFDACSRSNASSASPTRPGCGSMRSPLARTSFASFLIARIVTKIACITSGGSARGSSPSSSQRRPSQRNQPSSAQKRKSCPNR